MLVAGFVQAGGQSRRMGQNKAQILLQGRPLISYPLTALACVALQVGIIAADSTDYANYLTAGVEFYPDQWPGCGPLGGIGTALQNSKYEYVINLACDMPLIDKALLTLLLQEAAGYQVCVPCDAHGEWQPLCAVYHRSCLPSIDQLMATAGFAPRLLFSQVDTKIVPFTTIAALPNAQNYFTNINTPNELTEISMLALPEAT
jgi:molybdopterin-guanine dinucleotide biosynthesis protein A